MSYIISNVPIVRLDQPLDACHYTILQNGLTVQDGDIYLLSPRQIVGRVNWTIHLNHSAGHMLMGNLTFTSDSLTPEIAALFPSWAVQIHNMARDNNKHVTVIKGTIANLPLSPITNGETYCHPLSYYIPKSCTTLSSTCSRCGRVLSSYLDTYYGRDLRAAGMCADCRRKEGI